MAQQAPKRAKGSTTKTLEALVVDAATWLSRQEEEIADEAALILLADVKVCSPTPPMSPL